MCYFFLIRRVTGAKVQYQSCSHFKFPSAPCFCLCWHAIKASCSSWANSESLQAAANLRYTCAFKAVIRRADDLTLGFTQVVLMRSEQISHFTVGEMGGIFSFLFLFSSPLSRSDEELTGHRSCSCTHTHTHTHTHTERETQTR